MSQISNKHFPCLLLDRGCNKSEFKSPVQTMFSLNRNASSNTIDNSVVNALLSTEGGLYALINANCRCPMRN